MTEPELLGDAFKMVRAMMYDHVGDGDWTSVYPLFTGRNFEALDLMLEFSKIAFAVIPYAAGRLGVGESDFLTEFLLWQDTTWPEGR